jgi:hypothetical protein
MRDIHRRGRGRSNELPPVVLVREAGQRLDGVVIFVLRRFATFTL